MALEILEQAPDLDAIVCPVGGGGLIAGLSVAVKALRPRVRVIGVESVSTGNFTAALRAAKPVAVPLAPDPGRRAGHAGDAGAAAFAHAPGRRR